MEPAVAVRFGEGMTGPAASDNPAAAFFMYDDRCSAAAPRLAHSDELLVLYVLSASRSFSRVGCTAASTSHTSRRRPAIAASPAVGLKCLLAGSASGTNSPVSSLTARIVLA